MGIQPEQVSAVPLAFRVVAFALGVAILLDATVTAAGTVQWVTGLVLVGVIPPEAVIARARRR